MVVLGHGTLALKDLDQDAILVVLVGREDLRLLGGHKGVARNEVGHDAADGLDTERQGRDVEQNHLVGSVLARDHTTLHGGSVRHGLVGVDAAVRLLAVEKVLEQLLHLGDARRTADQHHLVNVVLLELGVLEHSLHGAERLLEEIHVEVLEASTRQRLVEVVAVVEGLNVNVGLVLRRESALGALDLAAELLDRTLVLAGVGAGLLLVQAQEVLHHTVVKVLTAEMRVAVGRKHLEDAVVDRQHRDIERAAAEIEHENRLLALVIEAVRDGGRSRLVDDALDRQARDHTGVLGRLALSVVKVRRHGHDRVRHLAAKVRLGRLLHLGQNHGRDLLGRVLLDLVLERHLNERLAALVDDLVRHQLHVTLHRRIVEATANETLDVEHRVLGIESRLVLGRLTDQALAVRERHIRRSDTVALVVGDDLDAALLEHTDARVRGTEIDTNNGTN